ncbi:MAG: hypothetical protein JW969_05965 [Spirochaetales bacterium]|nr:hypothetical protein [Spirochaetales bacterium]
MVRAALPVKEGGIPSRWFLQLTTVTWVHGVSGGYSYKDKHICVRNADRATFVLQGTPACLEMSCFSWASALPEK